MKSRLTVYLSGIKALRLKKEYVRLNLKEVLFQVALYFITFFHKSIFFTAWQLTIKPGKVCRRYVSGLRNFLFNPVEYLVIMCFLVIIFNLRYHFFENSYDYLKVYLDLLPDVGDFLLSFFKYVEKYTTITNIIAIPVFSIVSYALFIDKNYNFTEVVVMNIYVAAQQMLFLIIFTPVLEYSYGLKNGLLMPLYGITSIIYNIWAYIGFFGRSTLSIILSILAVLLSYLLQFPFNLLIYYVIESYS